MIVLLLNALCAALAQAAAPGVSLANTTALPLGLKSNFTAAGFFPSFLSKEYYPGFGPNQTTVQPQPKVTSPVNGHVYPLALTNPNTIQKSNEVDPVTFPPSFVNPQSSHEIVLPNKLASLSTNSTRALAAKAIQQIIEIATGSVINGNCSKCVAGLGVAQGVALTAPWEVPNMLIKLCTLDTSFSPFTSCQDELEANSDGAMFTQMIALADVAGADGQYICSHVLGACPKPRAVPLDLSSWFAKPKPANARAPPPSGKSIKVLHVSDFHLDPRYATGSEADCSQFLCCRKGSNSTSAKNGTIEPAPRFGAYFCDTPMNLAGAAVTAIPSLVGEDIEFTLFTGDLVSHDDDFALSEEFVEYEMDITFGFFKKQFGGGPIYAALGNHDTYPQAFATPKSLIPNYLGTQFDWDYDHVSALWEGLGWISADVAKVSKATYGAYSTVTKAGLKIITINTDFWYNDNMFNFVNSTNPDSSGTLRFLTDELQSAEDKGQRAYVVGHVVSGWSGSNGVPNPTNLFYQIIDRFSPHVVAGIFFGHDHEDQLSIFYANNGTSMSAATAQAVSWIGPSITPLTNLNSGFRVYEVDAKTFDVIESFTWFANVSSFNELDGQDKVGPTFEFEYSAREAYGANISWPATAPLNATWWHLVTEQMEVDDGALVSAFNSFQGKSSVRTGNCTSAACRTAKVCYMRSGSTPLAVENCSGQFSSVQ